MSWQERAFSQPSLQALAWLSHLLRWTLAAIQPEWTTEKSTMPTQLRKSLLIDESCVPVAQILQTISLVNFEADVRLCFCFCCCT
jgi:hypothetical protein